MESRYFVLRMISAFYKVLALLAFATTTGAVFIEVTRSLQNSPAGADPMATVGSTISSSLSIVVVGIVAMITFFALSQIIDVLIAIRDGMAEINRKLILKGEIGRDVQ